MTVLGIDVGGSHDRTVLVALKGRSVRAVMALPLGMSLTDQAEAIRPYLAKADSTWIDASGKGLGLAEILKGEGVHGVTITGGKSWSRRSERGWRTSKATLLELLNVAVNTGLKVPADVPGADLLRHEMLAFMSQGADKAAASSGQHDDTIMALAMALFGLYVERKIEEQNHQIQQANR